MWLIQKAFSEIQEADVERMVEKSEKHMIQEAARWAFQER